MAWILETLVDRRDLCIFALVLARIAGLMIGAPILTGLRVPVMVRVVITVALALVIAPTQVGVLLQQPANALTFGCMLGAEVFLGSALGLAVSVTIAGLQLAGSIIGQLSGMSLAEAFDPCFETDVPLLSQFLAVLGVALFMVLGGHRLVVEELLESFAAMPPGHAVVDRQVVESLMTAVGEGFVLAIRAAAPAIAALLVASLTLAALSRAIPQLSAMSLGFGLNVFAALGGLWLSLGTIAYVFEEQLQIALEAVLTF